MICDFNVPYKIDNFHQLPKDTQILCDLVEGNEGVGFFKRAEFAAAHLLNIPERLFNIVANIVKLALATIVCTLTAGQSEILNMEFKLAAGRVAINVAGVAINLLGFFAPIHALQWQMHTIKNVTQILHQKVLEDDLNPMTIIPLTLAL